MYFNDFSRIQQQNLLLEETIGAILMIYMHPKLTKHRYSYTNTTRLPKVFWLTSDSS